MSGRLVRPACRQRASHAGLLVATAASRLDFERPSRPHSAATVPAQSFRDMQIWESSDWTEGFYDKGSLVREPTHQLRPGQPRAFLCCSDLDARRRRWSLQSKFLKSVAKP